MHQTQSLLQNSKYCVGDDEDANACDDDHGVDDVVDDGDGGENGAVDVTLSCIKVVHYCLQEWYCIENT